MIEILGDLVWPDIVRLLRGQTHTLAAISYVGGVGPSLLGLRTGDSIVIDGSDQSLRNGTVDPRAVAAWRRSGVHVYSLEGLHAKVIVADRAGADSIAIVGSANASRASRDSRAEAAIASTDPASVSSVGTLIHSWIAAAGNECDAQWQARANRTYRPPRPQPRRRAPSVTLDRRRMWIGLLEPTTLALSAGATLAVGTAQNSYSNVIVGAWQMPNTDLAMLKRGDTLILVNTSNGPHPHGRSIAHPPARVVDLVPGTRKGSAAAVFAYDSRLPSTTYARIRTSLLPTRWSFDAAVTDRAVIAAVLAEFAI